MRIKWTSVQDWVSKNHEISVPTSTHDRRVIEEALEREGRLEEHKKAIARVRERVRRWFKED